MTAFVENTSQSPAGKQNLGETETRKNDTEQLVGSSESFYMHTFVPLLFKHPGMLTIPEFERGILNPNISYCFVLLLFPWKPDHPGSLSTNTIFRCWSV